MLLYTCPGKKNGASLPVVAHPCGRASKALDEAGHRYELKVVGGFKLLPPTRRGKREEIRRLSGQEDVPLLVLDDGTVIQGSGDIVSWARANPAT